MKFGVADYGMNVWYGGLYDIEERLIDLKEIGFNGTERLEAVSEADALHKAGLYRKLGMDFSTCRGPSPLVGIEWTAALGKDYVWMKAVPKEPEFDWDKYVRQTNAMVKSCARWGIKAGIHNHMGTRIESQKELEDYLQACPGVGVVFDTGHLSAAGGDAVEIAKKYHDRICVMHLKDVNMIDASKREYKFCELGAGNTGLNNAEVMKALIDKGWDGWVHIEHDHHNQDPLVDLKTSLDYLRDNGIAK